MDHCSLRKVYGPCTAQDLEIVVSVKPANTTGGNSSHVSSSKFQWTRLRLSLSGRVLCLPSSAARLGAPPLEEGTGNRILSPHFK